MWHNRITAVHVYALIVRLQVGFQSNSDGPQHCKDLKLCAVTQKKQKTFNSKTERKSVPEDQLYLFKNKLLNGSAGGKSDTKNTEDRKKF